MVMSSQLVTAGTVLPNDETTRPNSMLFHKSFYETDATRSTCDMIEAAASVITWQQQESMRRPLPAASMQQQRTMSYPQGGAAVSHPLPAVCYIITF